MWLFNVVVEESVSNPGPVELFGHNALKGVPHDRTRDVALKGAAHEEVYVVHTFIQLCQRVDALKKTTEYNHSSVYWDRIKLY